MKKLMFILATLATAATVHAASVSWTCTYVAKSAENYVDGGLAYFVNAATLSRDNALALSGKGSSNVSKALEGFYSYNGGSDGKYTVAKASAVANSDLGLADATTGYNVYLVIFDTPSITDASNFYVTDAISLETLSGIETASIKWGDQEEASSLAGAWHAVGSGSSVPEPTSAMLLLLGFAGLALKRKNV